MTSCNDNGDEDDDLTEDNNDQKAHPGALNECCYPCDLDNVHHPTIFELSLYMYDMYEAYRTHLIPQMFISTDQKERKPSMIAQCLLSLYTLHPFLDVKSFY